MQQLWQRETTCQWHVWLVIPKELVYSAEVFICIRDSSQECVQGNEQAKKWQGLQWRRNGICFNLKSDNIMCMCLLVVMICSQVEGKWMHILTPRVCVPCMLNRQLIFAITGFSCDPLQGTKARLKNREWVCSPLFTLVNDEVVLWGINPLGLTILYVCDSFWNSTQVFFSLFVSPSRCQIPRHPQRLELRSAVA